MARYGQGFQSRAVARLLPPENTSLEEVAGEEGPARAAAPIPKELGPQVYGRATIQRIGEVFHMEDLTLGGIKRAVAWLTRG